MSPTERHKHTLFVKLLFYVLKANDFESFISNFNFKYQHIPTDHLPAR